MDEEQNNQHRSQYYKGQRVPISIDELAAIVDANVKTWNAFHSTTREHPITMPEAQMASYLLMKRVMEISEEVMQHYHAQPITGPTDPLYFYGLTGSRKVEKNGDDTSGNNGTV